MNIIKRLKTRVFYESNGALFSAQNYELQYLSGDYIEFADMIII